MLELTPLRYFLSAYETGTFSQAARVNEVSQPTVSAAIQKLESYFGEQLFIRSKAGLTATIFGERLYRESASSVAHLSALNRRVRNKPLQNVRVYCYPDILLGPYAASMQSIVRNTNNLEFRFTASAEDSDLSYTSQKCVPKGHGFFPILTESYGVAVGRHHPLASSQVICLKDLQKYSIIHRPYCPNADRFDLLEPDSETPVVNALHDQQVLDLIAAGLGIAFVPMSHGKAHPGIIVRHVSGQEAGQRTIGVSYRKTAFAKELAEKLAASALGV